MIGLKQRFIAEDYYYFILSLFFTLCITYVTFAGALLLLENILLNDASKSLNMYYGLHAIVMIAVLYVTFNFFCGREVVWLDPSSTRSLVKKGVFPIIRRTVLNANISKVLEAGSSNGPNYEVVIQLEGKHYRGVFNGSSEVKKAQGAIRTLNNA
jgi:hypothetical protein